MSGPRLLLVEDDARDQGRRRPEPRGPWLPGRDRRAPPQDALRAWDAERPDAILLDLGLPDHDGGVVVRRVRRDATTPILILSARSEERDKVAALEAGADDYVTKPFGLDELRARVGALLRRAGGPAADPMGVAAPRDRSSSTSRRRSVTVAGTDVDLTPREYELLKVMVGSPGRLLTKGRLLRAVWGARLCGRGPLPARLRQPTATQASGRGPERPGERTDHRRTGHRIPDRGGAVARSLSDR